MELVSLGQDNRVTVSLGRQSPKKPKRVVESSSPTGYEQPPKVAVTRSESEPKAGLLQQIAAREIWRMILRNIVPEDERVKHKNFQDSQRPFLNKIKKAFRRKHDIQQFTTIDWYFSIQSLSPAKLPDAFGDTVNKLINVKKWMAKKWFVKDSIIYLSGNEVLKRRIVGNQKLAKRALMRELETALINMEEFSDCPFFKFVFMLEVGEPEAVIGSYDDMFTPKYPRISGFFKYLLPQLSVCGISRLKFINITIGTISGFRNLLKHCPLLEELECCTESSGHIFEIGVFATKLRRLTLLGKPKHMNSAAFAEAFFGVQDMAEFCLPENCKLKNLEYIHLINAIKFKQDEFLMLMSRYSPNLGRVWSNHRNLPLRLPLAYFTHRSKLKELFLDFEGASLYINNPYQTVNSPAFLESLRAMNFDDMKFSSFVHGELYGLFGKKSVTKISIVMKCVTSFHSEWTSGVFDKLRRKEGGFTCFCLRTLISINVKEALRILEFLDDLRYFMLEIEGNILGDGIRRFWNAECLEFLGFRAAKSCEEKPKTIINFLTTLLARTTYLKTLRIQATEKVFKKLKEAFQGKSIQSWPEIHTLKIGIEGYSLGMLKVISYIVAHVRSIETVIIAGDYTLYCNTAYELRYSPIKVHFLQYFEDDSYQYY